MHVGKIATITNTWSESLRTWTFPSFPTRQNVRPLIHCHNVYIPNSNSSMFRRPSTPTEGK